MGCLKDYSLAITGALKQWWWPLESPGDQVDAISGLTAFAVIPFASSITTPPGKVLNGALLDKSAFTASPIGFSTGIVTDLAYTAGQGCSICGWARRVSGSIVNQNLVAGVTMYADAAGTIQNGALALFDGSSAIDVSAAGFPFFLCDLNNPHSEPLGTFFFFAIHYDGVTGKVSYQVNADPVVESVCTVTIPDSPYAKFEFYYGLIFPAGSGQFDEVCLFYPKLTQAQVDYIYNSGAGRTPPIVLP